MKRIFLFLPILFLFACQQNQPQQNAPTNSTLHYTINDTLGINCEGVYYFTIPDVACSQGGFLVSQKEVLNRSISLFTFADDYSPGSVLIDSTNPNCNFTKSLKCQVMETPNKAYYPYQTTYFKSFLKITQNNNVTISGVFHIKATRLQYENDTINVVGEFSNFNVLEN